VAYKRLEAEPKERLEYVEESTLKGRRGSADWIPLEASLGFNNGGF
jgi:hypothetical protein